MASLELNTVPWTDTILHLACKIRALLMYVLCTGEHNPDQPGAERQCDRLRRRHGPVRGPHREPGPAITAYQVSHFSDGSAQVNSCMWTLHLVPVQPRLVKQRLHGALSVSRDCVACATCVVFFCSSFLTFCSPQMPRQQMLLEHTA